MNLQDEKIDERNKVVSEKLIGLMEAGHTPQLIRSLLNLMFSRDCFPECEQHYPLSKEDRENIYQLWDFLDSINQDYLRSLMGEEAA